MTSQLLPGQQPTLNVFEEQIIPCSADPLTGFYRDGCCNTGKGDHGSHTICVTVTDKFLHYSKAQGNDLITERPEFGFPGLDDGDRWCLCASRWLEAHEDGCAPPVHLVSTHKAALNIVPLEILKPYATDIN